MTDPAVRYWFKATATYQRDGAPTTEERLLFSSFDWTPEDLHCSLTDWAAHRVAHGFPATGFALTVESVDSPPKRDCTYSMQVEAILVTT